LDLAIHHPSHYIELYGPDEDVPEYTGTHTIWQWLLDGWLYFLRDRH